ncbi:hypothetical protein HDV04_001079 [Boothiomyces sp. JEL0838]|nr:hypothetical protein HDV04_001079 [Boothiomyces sp. JEL0838]
MILLDWADLADYVVQEIERNTMSDIKYYSLGSINIGFNAIHSVIASYLFEQLKGMIASQMKSKKIEIKDPPTEKLTESPLI